MLGQQCRSIEANEDVIQGGSFLSYVGILIKASLGVDDRSVMLCLVSLSGQSVRVPIKKAALAELTDTISALTDTISIIYELQ
jgi:hypothetical protein